MLVAIAIVAALGVGLGIAWVVSGPKMQPDRAAEFCWNEFATRLGLEYDPGGILKGPYISGSVGTMSLLMDTFHQQGDGSKLLYTRCVVDAGGNLPEGFDGQAKAKATDDPAKRLLAQATRYHINNLIKKLGATISGGKIRLVRPGSVWSPQVMIKMVKHIVAICEFLCIDPKDVAGKLLHGSRDTTIPDDMRADFKRVLMETYPGSIESDSAAAELIDDPDPRTRLRAAKSLGAKGIPTLIKVGRDPGMTREVREEAVSHLIRTDAPEQVGAGIRNLLTSTHAEVFRVTLAVVRRMRYAPALRTLMELASDSRVSGDQAASITEAIGEMGDVNCQPLLINLLNHDFLLVRRRAAAALGRQGNANALPALDGVMKSSNVNRRLKELCNSAMKSIRMRSGIAEPEGDAEAS
jgi:hypothetical protein